MKKIVLFAAAMTICAGIAFAQQPTKKNTNKANTTTTATTKEVKNEQRQHCGNCPHHAQGNKNAEASVKANTDNKNTACEGKKNCCKKQNQPANKSNNSNTAAVKK
ncbi:MAG: hypothetical protein IKN84_06155 [Bacteroidales bacterium]|jgi:hypothetical protein|nr:hypothetical protein [Bacteroidales bacterium]